jgi:AraC-like DNA-binding protein
MSVRTMERYFAENARLTLRDWLIHERHRQAFELLRSGVSVKETASRMGYNHPTNFTRSFRKQWGICPQRVVLLSKTPIQTSQF